jgi:hypothetical protein
MEFNIAEYDKKQGEALAYAERHSWLIRRSFIAERLVEEAVRWLYFGDNWLSKEPNRDALMLSRSELNLELTAYLRDQTDHYGILWIPLLWFLIPTVVRLVLNWWHRERELIKV